VGEGTKVDVGVVVGKAVGYAVATPVGVTDAAPEVGVTLSLVQPLVISNSIRKNMCWILVIVRQLLATRARNLPNVTFRGTAPDRIIATIDG
jgi:hypothetical protein